MIENQFKVKGFLVWGICALFFLYEFLLRTVTGTFQHPLMQDLELSAFYFSLLSTTIFLLVYGLMQIPVGLIVDNIGLKRSLLIGTVLCTASSFGFANSYSYGVALTFRMMMGFGASFGFICLLMSVHDWMPRKYTGMFIGLSQFIGTIGPMSAAGPLDSIAHSGDISWRLIFMFLGGMGCAIILLTILFVENNERKTGSYTVLYRPERAKKAIFRLFTRIQPWYIAIFSAMTYFAVEYLSENEGRHFLSLKGVSATSASYMLTISWVGYAISCPLVGFISDFIERRKIMMILCAGSGIIAMIIILYLPTNNTYLKIAFFMLGVSSSGQTVGFATMAEQFKKQFIAVGFGLNNAMLNMVSAINAPLIGVMLDSLKEQTGEISLENYLLVFNFLIVILAIAFIISVFFIKETYRKSVAEFTVISF